MSPTTASSGRKTETNGCSTRQIDKMFLLDCSSTVSRRNRWPPTTKCNQFKVNTLLLCPPVQRAHTLTHFALDFSLDVDRLDETFTGRRHIARGSPCCTPMTPSDRPTKQQKPKRAPKNSSNSSKKLKIQPKPVHCDSGKGSNEQAEHVNFTSALDNVCTGNEQAGRLGHAPRAADRWRWWSHRPLRGVAFDSGQQKKKFQLGVDLRVEAALFTLRL